MQYCSRLPSFHLVDALRKEAVRAAQCCPKIFPVIKELGDTTRGRALTVVSVCCPKGPSRVAGFAMSRSLGGIVAGESVMLDRV